MSKSKISIGRVLIGFLGGVMVLGLVGWVVVRLAVKDHPRPDSRVMASSLASAVENFYGEYNRLPDVGGNRVSTEEPAGKLLLDILLGLEGSQSGTQNTRNVIFLQGKEAKGRKGGIAYGPDDSVEGVFDPFGNPFIIVLNSKYEDELVFGFGGKTVRLRGKMVAVYGPGKDGVLNTPDDIKSWN